MPRLPMPALLVALVLPAVSGHADPARPVVVELFTSQGCSSCPPADAILTQLARTRPDVLPLAFHVTYWNSLGWKDPYSFEEATWRQRGYAGLAGIGGVYTPQAVVEGRRDVVGSDGPGLLRAIAAEAARLRALDIAVRREGGGLTIALPDGPGAGSVLVIGYDAAHATRVGRGENAGATLLESNIVRALAVAGVWQGRKTELHAAVPDGERLAVIVQAEDGGIIGAVRVPGAKG